MDIKVESFGLHTFKNVTVFAEKTTISVGFLEKDECVELAAKLRKAAEQLMDGVEGENNAIQP